MNRLLPLSLMFALFAAPHGLAQAVGGEWHQLASVFGEHDEWLGADLARMPDMNGDGISDVAVGAPRMSAVPGFPPRVGGVRLIDGATGTVLWQYLSSQATSDGYRVTRLPDVTGDGWDDVLSSNGGDTLNPNGPHVVVLDGRTGAVVREHWESPAFGLNSKFGYAVLGLPDVDGDGRGDYVVSAPDTYTVGAPFPVGRLDCYSGQTGQLLWQVFGPVYSDRLGWALAGGFDWTGDGIMDIAAGAPGTASGKGAIRIVDGAAGAFARYLPAPFPSHLQFGNAVAAVPDADADGIADIVTGSQSSVGHAHMYSVGQQSVLWTVDGGAAPFLFGVGRIHRVSDYDQDGYPDVVVSERQVASGVDRLEMLSGRDGASLAEFFGAHAFSGLSISGVASVDVDGFGLPELLLGEVFREDPVNSYADGAVQRWSFDPYLLSAQSSISVSAPGIAAFALDFPVSEASRTYAMLVSESGRGPTVLGGIDVPLTAGPLLTASTSLPLPAPLGGFRGTLDAEGDAVVLVSLTPASLAPYVGSEIYLAAVTYSGVSGRLSSASVRIVVDP